MRNLSRSPWSRLCRTTLTLSCTWKPNANSPQDFSINYSSTKSPSESDPQHQPPTPSPSSQSSTSTRHPSTAQTQTRLSSPLKPLHFLKCQRTSRLSSIMATNQKLPRKRPTSQMRARTWMCSLALQNCMWPNNSPRIIVKLRLSSRKEAAKSMFTP